MATVIKQKQNIVLGKITDAKGLPLANLKVEIYDVDMREWQLLADKHIKEEGKYCFTYFSQLRGMPEKNF